MRLDVDRLVAYAGVHDGHDAECPRCMVAVMLVHIRELETDLHHLVGLIGRDEDGCFTMPDGRCIGWDCMHASDQERS